LGGLTTRGGNSDSRRNSSDERYIFENPRDFQTLDLIHRLLVWQTLLPRAMQLRRDHRIRSLPTPPTETDVKKRESSIRALDAGASALVSVPAEIAATRPSRVDEWLGRTSVRSEMIFRIIWNLSAAALLIGLVLAAYHVIPLSPAFAALVPKGIALFRKVSTSLAIAP